jgi:hypothetical protein
VRLLISEWIAVGVTAALAAAAFWLPGGASADMTRAEFEARKERLGARYDVARRKCDTYSGNARDICMAEAKGRDKVARMELEERYKDSPKARYNARMARAEADYDVAKEKCDDRAGPQKELCLKEAKAAFAREKADAAMSRVSQ